MELSGLLKLTLLDYPGYLSCTLFTAGCNFRCPFCQNASLVLSPSSVKRLEEQEVLDFLKSRIGILEGVCITGGEPTLNKDLPAFLRKVKAMGYLIKLDTNGSNFELLRSLIEESLIDYVAMDIKNSKVQYNLTSGLLDYDLSQIEKSIAYLLRGTLPYEFRTTLVKEFHTEESLHSIGEWLSGSSHYYLQGFVDSGDLIRPGLSGFSKEEMLSFTVLLKSYLPNTFLRGID